MVKTVIKRNIWSAKVYYNYLHRFHFGGCGAMWKLQKGHLNKKC